MRICVPSCNSLCRDGTPRFKNRRPRLSQRRRSIPISSATYTTSLRFVERGRLLALTWRDGGLFHTRLGDERRSRSHARRLAVGRRRVVARRCSCRPLGALVVREHAGGRRESRRDAGPLRRGSPARPDSRRSFCSRIRSARARARALPNWPRSSDGRARRRRPTCCS